VDDEPEPPTGLAALDTLLERSRTAGLSVTFGIRGTPRALASGVDQAAYRILQESLTNAARHGSGSADAQIRYNEHDLELAVANPLAPGAVDQDGEAGHGILGMRERATLLSGSLETSSDDGCFCVHARLPYAHG
jgi:signal transduction histidine kinase